MESSLIVLIACRFVVVILLPDWHDSEGGPQYGVETVKEMLRGSDPSDREDEKRGPLTIEPFLMDGGFKSVGEGSLISLCSSIQRALMPELEALQQALAIVGVSVVTDTPRLFSGATIRL
jgi:hypothetical protein